MMKTAPIAPFVMTQTQLLLEFEVVTLDAPAHLDGGHQRPEGNVCGQGGQEIARWLGFVFGPLDEQPFFFADLIGVRGAHPYPHKARGERCVTGNYPAFLPTSADCAKASAADCRRRASSTAVK